MATSVADSGIEIAGILKRLPPLPNAEHQHLFNAENCTVSAEGRVFITGSTAVYEILPAQGHAGPKAPRYEYREIRITAPEVPPDCFRNGITTSGHYLYLACAHVHQWDKSVFPEWGSPLNAISQTQTLNFLRLLMTEIFCHADSYIVRADLRKDPLEFSECFTLPKKCFANGLTAEQGADQDVAFLYLANSIFGQSSIFRITWPNEPAKEPRDCVEWFKTFTHQLVNGLKYRANRVYYTCIQFFPPSVPSVYRIAVHDGEADTPQIEDVSKVHGNLNPERVFWTFGFFDDLDVLEHGLVVTNGADFSDFPQTVHLHHGMPTGSLIFVSSKGELIKVFRDERLLHPSSVKVVDRESSLFARGDMIITDKGEDGEYAAFVFIPDDTCRSWFM